MNILSKYEIFFTLRDKYPERSKLIAELMRYYFQNHESFSQMTYLNGNFSEEDIRVVFEEANLPTINGIIHSDEIRSKSYTILILQV